MTGTAFQQTIVSSTNICNVSLVVSSCLTYFNREALAQIVKGPCYDAEGNRF